MGKVLMAGIASLLTVPKPGFPEEPTEYEQIYLYTESATFTAPEDGWYQIELFGRSGAGGASTYKGDYKNLAANDKYSGYNCLGAANGGGGGGGAYCCSNLIKLNKGDIVEIIIDITCTVTIHSTTGEIYEVMTCTSGADGGNGSVTRGTSSTNSQQYTVSGGAGGVGGEAFGGNQANINGNQGTQGKTCIKTTPGASVTVSSVVAEGGAAAIEGGNIGGNGGLFKASVTHPSESLHYITPQISLSPEPAKEGFCKIYAGNTNAA